MELNREVRMLCLGDGDRLERLLCYLWQGLHAISLLQGLVQVLLISLTFGGPQLRIKYGSDKRVPHLIKGGLGGIRTYPPMEISPVSLPLFLYVCSRARLMYSSQGI